MEVQTPFVENASTENRSTNLRRVKIKYGKGKTQVLIYGGGKH